MPLDDRDDYDDDRPRRRRDRAEYDRPHRGGLILAFGIISLVIHQCGIGLVLGILAWIWGTADLRAMDEGEMDPEGRSLTQAGRICGIIGVCIGALMFLAVVAYMVFIFAFVAALPKGPPAPVPPPPTAPAPRPGPGVPGMVFASPVLF